MSRGKNRAGEDRYPGETAQERGQRYLSEGRLTLQLVEGATIQATCLGHRRIYRLGHDPEHGWWCSCGPEDPCAHVIALQLVTRPASRVERDTARDSSARE
jgi:uncharacterized Zn finger protein